MRSTGTTILRNALAPNIQTLPEPASRDTSLTAPDAQRGANDACVDPAAPVRCVDVLAESMKDSACGF